MISLCTTSASAQQIEWHQDLAEAKVKARDTNRLVWLHFTAEWCAPCKRLDSFVFTSLGVIRAADQNTVAVKIDADANAALVKQLEVPRLPYDVVMTPSGRVILNRSSPKDSSGFRKMLNALDVPLQALTSGDREVINGRIDKLSGVIKQSKGLNLKKSDLDLEGPSHQMASTTVEGQRLERGFESWQRTSEIRAAKAESQKRSAEMFIAKAEKRPEPKISENPFFKSANASGETTLPINKPFSATQPQATANVTPKVMSNSFVKQNNVAQPQLATTNPSFVPPLPPAFAKKPVEKAAVEKVMVKADQDAVPLTLEERAEFSFTPTESKKPAVATQKPEAKPVLALAQSTLAVPKAGRAKPNFAVAD